jgi:uncharacterized protein (TIGR02147 family)
MVDIFEHHDYRRFLAAWFEARKVANPRLSHRWFARKLGTTDPSALHNIVTGRRRIGRDRVKKLIEIIELDEEEARYFEHMVAFDQSDDAEEQARALAAMRALRAGVRPVLDDEFIEVMSSVRYMAVREMARFADFQADPAWIAPRMVPPLSVGEVTDVLDRLMRLGLLVQGDDGRWGASTAAVQTPMAVPSYGSLPFHRDCDELGRQALAGLPANEAETSFTGHTLSLPAAKLPELRRLLWQAFHEIAQRTDAMPDPDCVVQLNVRMFPLTALPSPPVASP